MVLTDASSFRYILRYGIDPERDADTRIAELVELCRSARIEEVMLLIAAEELSDGHLTDPELEAYCRMGRRLREQLSLHGIDLSLNPWTTLYQVPRGRALKPGQSFRPMVGETGIASSIVACPLCPEWQNWLGRTFARLAAELRPVAIWVEDDWRLHNHGAELGWGGCFCDAHLTRFSQMVGEEVSRDDLLDAILRPGDPHPWRRLWFDLSRESLLEPMRVVRQMVETAHPATRLALMSSRPDQHSAEGRDWPAMQEALGNDPVFLIRPHMEPYTEERALRTTPSVTRQTIACLSGPVGIYPELENSPRCGIYSKSGRYTVWQMLEAAAFGSPGITINHYDNMGNGTALDPDFGQHLAAVKPVLNALAALHLDDRSADGAQVLVSTTIADHLRLPEPPAGVRRQKINGEALSLQMQQNPSGGGSGGFEGSMQSLVHPSPVWAETCAILGIAHRITTRIEPDRGPIFVNGQTLRAFPDADIERLLGGFVILDAVAVEVLRERGFGDAISVRQLRWRSLAADGYSYETILADDPAAHGVADPRVCAQRNSSRLLEIEPAPDSGILTRIHKADHTPLWPGAILSPTPQGGKVLSLAYPLDGGAQFFMSFFTRFRRIFFQNLLLENPTGAALLMGPDGTRVYRSQTTRGTFFAVLNATLDSIAGFTLRPNANEHCNGQWLHLDSSGEWLPVQPVVQPGRIQFDTTIEPLKGAFFLHSNSSK